MTDLAAAVESVAQLSTVWRATGLDRDRRADVRDLPGIAVRWADRRSAFWDAITLNETGADRELLLEFTLP